jgi:thiol-disulfide isomerase/thioredoxin
MGLVSACDGATGTTKPTTSDNAMQDAGADAATSESPQGAGGTTSGDAPVRDPKNSAAGSGGTGGSSGSGGTSIHQTKDTTQQTSDGTTVADAGNGLPTTEQDAAISGESGAGGEAGSGGVGGTTGDVDAGSMSAAAGAGGAGGTAGQASGGTGGSAASNCNGPTPPSAAWTATPAAFSTPDANVKLPGAAMPRYQLTDFQPTSCGYQATYGLDVFVGRPTVVALFASWCPYCQAQVEELQRMQLELEEAGKPVYMVVINASPAHSGTHDPIGDQWELTRRVTFPLLQDTDAVNAWSLHSGDKDDLYIYASDGKLVQTLNNYDSIKDNIDLTTSDGYTYVKGIVQGAN